MKTVIIKEIRLLNFKGLRDLTVEFDPALTEIYGRNGIGKTSIFDGFTWLLFGKNSEDRKQFGIKTYDEAGNIRPKARCCSVFSAMRTMRRTFRFECLPRARAMRFTRDGINTKT